MDDQADTGNQDSRMGQVPVNDFSSGGKKTNYWLVLGGLVLFCFVVFGFGGYYLGKKSQSLPQEINKTHVQPTVVPSDKPVSTGWTTYQNTANGFEFNYPTSFVRQETSGGERLADFKTADGKELLVRLDNATFTIDYLKKYAPTGGEASAPQQQTFGNNSFYYYGPGGGGVCYPDQYFTNLNGKILIFNFIGCDNDKTPSEEIKAIERQILSTFKTDNKTLPSPTSTSQPITIKYSPKSGWETYTDEVAGFSFQYNTTPTQPYNFHQALGNNQAGKSVSIMSCNTPPNNHEVCLEQYTATIYSNYSGGPLRDWMSKNINDYPNCQRYYTDVAVSGKNAMLATSNCSSWGETYVLLPSEPQMIVFLTKGYSRNDNTGKITLQKWINEALSTFKFSR
nr:MAG: hypothetical protein A2V48_01485 [Candidatus Amesbacteria bacterium RBG_19FT_COMBO_48_16]